MRSDICWYILRSNRNPLQCIVTLLGCLVHFTVGRTNWNVSTFMVPGSVGIIVFQLPSLGNRVYSTYLELHNSRKCKILVNVRQIHPFVSSMDNQDFRERFISIFSTAGALVVITVEGVSTPSPIHHPTFCSTAHLPLLL